MATPMSRLLEEVSRECKQVASAFSEFLEQVLRTRRGLYWLGE